MIQFLFALVTCISAFHSTAYAKTDSETAVLVDKKTNQLHVSRYEDGQFKILKSYHATLGKVKGDKEDENDLKTPEGIYIFNNHLKPPSIKKKLGCGAFDIGFPNPYDQLAGRTGNSIMLHGTNEPGRLKNNYDSEGCIVVRNEELNLIDPYIKLKLTPILIFSELTEEYLNPGQDQRLKTFFADWLKAWQGKDLEHYMDHYHSDFSAQGKNKAAWRTYKKQLNSRYSEIQIKPEKIHYYRHPKYSVVTFTQNYQSKLKSGQWGHRSTGTKLLYIAEEEGKLKIIAETFERLVW